MTIECASLETIIADMTSLVREVHELGSAEGAAKLRAELSGYPDPPPRAEQRCRCGHWYGRAS